MSLGPPIRPPPPPAGPEWVPCGKEREINTRTGMKRTAIKKNEAANPLPYVPVQSSVQDGNWPNYGPYGVPTEDEDNL